MLPKATEQERHLRILNHQQLKASVRRELERLLNTRCSIPLHRLGEEERSVINYGIPDFSSLSPHNADDHALIASIVGQTMRRLNHACARSASLDQRSAPSRRCG